MTLTNPHASSASIATGVGMTSYRDPAAPRARDSTSTPFASITGIHL